ncbi:MAG TPA: Gmad2 immunoglobulin-like domain-containing protein [Terriglobales bacterium]|nr:Gmad2 immunoglobulin-like domain-containing protein [Terriglobales bacterium]
MVGRYSLILLLGVFLVGCRPATPPPPAFDQTQIASTGVPPSTSSAATPTPIRDEVKELRNTQYQLGAADSLQVVQLNDGTFEQGLPGSDNYLSVKVTDFVAMGDLNGDGTDEVAALVSENYGGTGVFVFLAVYARENGKLTFQTSTMVDDRPQLNTLSIESGEIFLDAIIHGQDDPMCCPTLKTTRHYRLAENQLDMTDYATFTPDGKPRAIKIESPRDGTEVFTSVPLEGSVSMAPFEDSLVYRIYDVSGIELSAGAIPVSVPDAGTAGTFNTLINLGKVLSGTIIHIEVQDLSAKDGSLLAMDSVELVVK